MAATKERLYGDALRIIADARLATITDDVESRYALDDAWDEAVTFVLRQAAWLFAVDRGALVTAVGSVAGYSIKYTYPASHLRTVKLFVPTADGRDHPADVAELPAGIFSNAAGLYIEHVSSNYADPDVTDWPEHFAQTVAAYLAFLVAERVTGERGAAGRFSQLFNQLLGEAIRIDAKPDDRWLPFQRQGQVVRGARTVATHGFWRFSLEHAGISVEAGTPQQGFDHSFAIPADHLRTHSIFDPNDGREYPIDVRESEGHWHTNETAFNVRYVSSDLVDDSTLWTEPFHDATLAFLEADLGRATEAGGPLVERYQALLVAGLRSDGVEPSRWLPFQLNGKMRVAALDLLRRADWRFALTQATITTPAGVPAAGLLYSYAQPPSWLRTHKLYVDGGAKPETSFDVRERGGYWLTDADEFHAVYVTSALGLDARLWPEPFRAALLAYLEAGMPPDDGGENIPQWQQALALAIAALAEAPDPWLPHQLSGRFERARKFVMQQGYWVYRDPAGVMRGLKERLHNYLDDQVATDPSHGFPYRYPLPDDWFKTHALFVPWDGQECPINIRESAHDWSTDAESFVARYVSDEVLDPATWPEAIDNAVLAWADWQAAPADQAQLRAQEYAVALAAALEAHSRPEDEFLRFQLDGSFDTGRKELLERGRWRFAIKTETLTDTLDPLPSEESEGLASSPYAYRFIPPNDWLRTVTAYYLVGTGLTAARSEIDFRDEQGAIHANFTPVVLRYVSRLGLDSTRWPANFRAALLALLQYQEACADPAKSGIVPIKLAAYKDAIREAERLDDSRDMPLVIRGRLPALRRGYSSHAREHGWHLWR